MIAFPVLVDEREHARHSDAPGRLLHIDPTARTLIDRTLDELPTLLAPGDLLVVNDAATLPASLFGRGPMGEPIEVRLCGVPAGSIWRAVLFGDGDWHARTEDRARPPVLGRNARIVFAPGLAAEIASVSALSPRLVDLHFDRDGDELWAALYRHGRPVQYAYEHDPLPLARMQTPYATRPWAAEMPSAGRPLRLALLSEVARRGVQIASLTHAAGLSSTGDADLDAALPFPERYEIPSATADAVRKARENRNRVVAVGTTVVRALEGCAASHDGTVMAGEGETDLVITRDHRPIVVDGLLSGVHAADSSHFALLAAFLPPQLEATYLERLAVGGYRGHEFGDSTLVLGA